ncbi:MAG: hypothetical protein ACI9MR_001013 [Myxococcota bacterium]|jgi:hypothetical protein
MTRHLTLAASLAVLLATGCKGQTPPPAEVTFGCWPATTQERSENLRCWVEYLSAPALGGRNNGSAGSAKARAAIVEAFTNAWLQKAGDRDFEQDIPQGTNVIAMIAGQSALRSEVVVLGAHYDHIGVIDGEVHPGADDNATGVAVLVEVARALAASPPDRSVLLIAFDSEEPPEFLTAAMGSRWWVDHPTLPLSRVKAMVALDMLGGDMWPGFESPLVLLGLETFDTPPVADMASLAASIKPASPGAAPVGLAALHLRAVEDLPSGRQAFSDYGAFRDRRIPVALLTTGRSPHYHRPSDTVAHIQFDKVEAAVAVTEALIRRLASADFSPAWRAVQPLRVQDARSVLALLEAAVGKHGKPAPIGKKAIGVLRSRIPALAAIAARSPTSAIVEAEAKAVIEASLVLQSMLGGH